MVHKTNAFHVARELNEFEAPGFSVATGGNEDKVTLITFESNMYKDFDKNKNIIGSSKSVAPPTQEALDNNSSLVYTIILILRFLPFVLCGLQIGFHPLSLHIWSDSTLNLDKKIPILIPEIKSYSKLLILQNHVLSCHMG